jgi:hypothetical protein
MTVGKRWLFVYLSLGLLSAGGVLILFCLLNGAMSRPVQAQVTNESAGGGWTIETVDDGGFMPFVSLARDSRGEPHLAYVRCTDPYYLSCNLWYAWHDGTEWHFEIADSGFEGGGGISLALSADGYPRIAYYDRRVYLKYAKWNGTSWTIQTVEGVASLMGDRDVSLALDALGRPHISYKNGSPLKYAAWNGVTWDIQTVDGSGCG